jgi:hypothetical protein
MRQIAFFLLALPIVAFSKDTWKSGQIKVIDTDEWCGRPGAVDWPAICGTSPSGATRLVNDSRGDAVRPTLSTSSGAQGWTARSSFAREPWRSFP